MTPEEEIKQLKDALSDGNAAEREREKAMIDLANRALDAEAYAEARFEQVKQLIYAMRLYEGAWQNAERQLVMEIEATIPDEQLMPEIGQHHTESGRPGLAESGAVQRPDAESCGQVQPLPDSTQSSHAVGTGNARPKEPPLGLLMSMAMRYDHGLGCPGYYDSPMFAGQGVSHAQRVESTLRTMRQLYEEVSGYGFYRPEKEADYAAMIETPSPLNPESSQVSKQEPTP